jgi:enoyl-CoA hydratase/carnithine racemase
VHNGIRLERRHAVAAIVIDRPDKMNAFTLPMYEALAEAIATVGGDGTVRAVLLYGSGGRAFAAGTDIRAFEDFTTAEHGLAYERRMDEILSLVERCSVPTVAALAGVCTGGGAALAAVCDLRIATTNLRFGVPIARTLGNCLSAANLARLTAVLGPARVKDLLMTGRLLDGAEALAAGFVREVVADSETLERRGWELATEISGLAPSTLKATKELMRRNAALMPAADDRDVIGACYTSREFHEGRRAFLAKRPPRWFEP